MRAVWSFWSKPFEQYMGRTWKSPLHHYLAWGLSLRLASRHYPETMLVTDLAGKRLLIDELGLPFTSVSTALEELHDQDAGWWTLGKLTAYSLQDRPFIHLDTDVFLWKPLSLSVSLAPVFAQCTEDHHPVDEWCGAGDLEAAFAAHALPLPAEWQWLRKHHPSAALQANCGILGGNDTAFLRHYALTVIDLLCNSTYARLWSTFQEKAGFNPVIEQFTLATLLRYHQQHSESPYPGLDIRYVFDSFMDSYNSFSAARAGFTHLLGNSKQNPVVIQRLEQRTQREDPRYYQRCLAVSRDQPSLMTTGT